MNTTEQQALDKRMAEVRAHVQVANRDEEMRIGDRLDAILGKPRQFDKTSPYLYYPDLDGNLSACGITYRMDIRGYSDFWAHDDGSRGLLLGVAFLEESAHLIKDEVRQ